MAMWTHNDVNKLQSRAPEIAKLVYNSNFTMVYGTYNELVFMGFINHLIAGGPHIVPSGYLT